MILGLLTTSLPVTLLFGVMAPLLVVARTGSCATVPLGGEVFEGAEIEPAGDGEGCGIDVDMCEERCREDWDRLLVVKLLSIEGGGDGSWVSEERWAWFYKRLISDNVRMPVKSQDGVSNRSPGGAATEEQFNGGTGEAFDPKAEGQIDVSRTLSKMTDDR